MKSPTFISSSDIEREVRALLLKALAAKKRSFAQFGKNVIDPFSAMFEMSGFAMEHVDWAKSETARQAQKTLQNHIGTFHKNILGCAEDWQDLRTGSVVDLKSDTHKIVAEVKNKYSTISGGKLSELYRSLDELVSPKSSVFKGFTAYYVTIIPRKCERRNVPFTPSDKSKGAPCAENPLIREIDGVSFYDMVFTESGALKQIFQYLPTVINKLAKQHSELAALSSADIKHLNDYFSQAFAD